MKKVILFFLIILLANGLLAQGRSAEGVFLYEKHKVGKKIRYNLNIIEGFGDIVDTFIYNNKNIVIVVSYNHISNVYRFALGKNNSANSEYKSFIKSTNRFYQPIGSKKRIPIIVDLDKRFTELNNICCFYPDLVIYIEYTNFFKIMEFSFLGCSSYAPDSRSKQESAEAKHHVP